MFGIELIDAGLLPAMAIALVAGIVSFLSPCVLPIVPPYLAYMSGVSLNDMSSQGAARRKAVIAALCFVMGRSTVFLILGFTKWYEKFRHPTSCFIRHLEVLIRQRNLMPSVYSWLKMSGMR